MTKDEAMKLALEALEDALPALEAAWYNEREAFKVQDAITAIKQARPTVPLTKDEMWDLLGKYPKLPEYTRAVEARCGIAAAPEKG
jgi:hypothetical protein